MDIIMPGYTDAHKHYSNHEDYSNTSPYTWEHIPKKLSYDKDLVDHPMNLNIK